MKPSAVRSVCYTINLDGFSSREPDTLYCTPCPSQGLTHGPTCWGAAGAGGGAALHKYRSATANTLVADSTTAPDAKALVSFNTRRWGVDRGAELPSFGGGVEGGGALGGALGWGEATGQFGVAGHGGSA